MSESDLPTGVDTPAAPGTTTAADVRAWAKENGKTVGDRGRISASLLAEYAAAKGV